MNEELIQKYLEAKAAEAKATAARVELGDAIAAELSHPDEGSKTHTIGEYKITITGVVNRKIDWTSLNALNLGDKAPVKTKKEIDVAGLKWWEQKDSAVYQAILRTITSTPGRVQIKIIP